MSHGRVATHSAVRCLQHTALGAMKIYVYTAVLQAGAPVVVYVRPEDEFLHKHATASYTFPIEGKAVGKDELQPLRLVMLLPANKVAAARWVDRGGSRRGGGDL